MAHRFTPNATFDYIPLVTADRKRTIKASGYVNGVGKAVWVDILDSFPDMTNTVHRVLSDGLGNLAADVTISGTQEKPFSTIRPGNRFSERHFFVFRMAEDGRIAGVTAYWNGKSFNDQLGHQELD
jgi:predicted ester cyclase